MSYKIICAYTARTNTKETDMMRYVPHIVKYVENGEKKSMEVTAECPMDATETARGILKRKEDESQIVK